MNKMERYKAAVAGEPVDRAPRTCWAHHFTETHGSEGHTRAHSMFHKEHDWDILKIVNDFHYPFPDGVEDITCAADLEKFEVATLDEYMFREEAQCIANLRAEFPDVPIVQTQFCPLRQLIRRAGNNIIPVLLANQEATHKALENITISMEKYFDKLVASGCNGFFFGINYLSSTGGIVDSVDPVYTEFMKPYIPRMLRSMKKAGLDRFVHLHGVGVSLTILEDMEYEVISAGDRNPTNYSLKELRELTGKTAMGGIDEVNFGMMTAQEVRDQIKDTREQFGEQGLIIAPGCTIQTWAPAHLIRILADTTT